MRFIKNTFLALGLISMSAVSFADQNTLNAIEDAAMHQDVALLRQYEQSLEGYDKSFAAYKLAVAYHYKNQVEQALELVNKSIDNLKALSEQEPSYVEALVLMSHLQGYRAGLSPSQKSSSGMQAIETLKKAEQLAPNNPRMYLVKGIMLAYMPEAYGGGFDKAIAQFDKAIKAFRDDDVMSGYHWGYADAYTWRGTFLQSLGKHAQAQADWENALSINPNHAWAKSLLNSKGDMASSLK